MSNQKPQDLFEELSVTELEDRLELVNRCLCRVKGSEEVSPSN